NGLYHTVELGGNVHGAGPAAVGAAGVRVVLQLDPEGVVELRDRAAQHHGTASRVLLHDGQPMGLGELPHRIQVRAPGAMAPRKVGARHVTGGALAARELLQAIPQARFVGRPDDHRDFQPLRRVRGSQGVGIRQRGSLASREWTSGHGASSSAGCRVRGYLSSGPGIWPELSRDADSARTLLRSPGSHEISRRQMPARTTYAAWHD